MRVFKNIWFNRFAGKEGITDAELRETVDQLEAGQVDANLGGDVYKVRVRKRCQSPNWQMKNEKIIKQSVELSRLD